MDFGKRRQTNSKPPIAKPTTSLPNLARAPSNGSGIGTLLRTLGMFFAGLMTIAIGYQVLMGVGRVAEKRLDDQFSKIAIPPLQTMALLQTSHADGMSLKDCTFEGPPTKYSIKNNPFRRNDLITSDAHFANRSNFMQCVVESSSLILCDPKVRAAFVADVTKFLVEYSRSGAQTMADGLNNIGNDRFAEVRSEIMTELSNAHPGIIPAGRPNELANARPAFGGGMAAAREQIFDSIKTAAENGLISTRDFGFFGNKEAKVAINSTPVVQSKCDGRTDP